MVLPRKDLPDVGELLIATVNEIYDFGAYVALDEYGNMRAFLPWSEVSSKWVRDIRDVIREGQKIVVKAIRVDRSKREVDVSLKRTSDTERQRKMQWWKRYSKACKIIELVAERLGKSREEAYREVVWRFEDTYGDVMYALEEAISKGRSVFEEAGVPEEWVEPLLEEAKRHVKMKEVAIRYKLIVQSLSPDGVERVKKCLESIASYLDNQQVRYRLYASGCPRYTLEVYSEDYKVAEKYAEDALSAGLEEARKLGVDFSFERERA